MVRTLLMTHACVGIPERTTNLTSCIYHTYSHKAYTVAALRYISESVWPRMKQVQSWNTPKEYEISTAYQPVQADQCIASTHILWFAASTTARNYGLKGSIIYIQISTLGLHLLFV